MSASFREILLKLCRREDLSRDEAREAFELIMSGQATLSTSARRAEVSFCSPEIGR